MSHLWLVSAVQVCFVGAAVCFALHWQSLYSQSGPCEIITLSLSWMSGPRLYLPLGPPLLSPSVYPVAQERTPKAASYPLLIIDKATRQAGPSLRSYTTPLQHP